MKKLLSAFLMISMVSGLLAVPAFASTDVSSVSASQFTAQSFTVVTNGYVEHFYINENREVYVNGRNITMAAPKPTAFWAPNSYSGKSEDWTHAYTYTIPYDLTGLTVAGATEMLTRLGLTITVNSLAAAAGSMVVGGVFQSGAGIEDRQDTSYKDIDQSRPDMKIDHEFYLYFDLFGERYVEEYLGGYTTYYYN